jgi:hypothetical protein
VGNDAGLGTGTRAPIVGHRRRADGGVRAAIGTLRPGDEGIRGRRETIEGPEEVRRH